jgi:hypothetical protein
MIFSFQVLSSTHKQEQQAVHYAPKILITSNLAVRLLYLTSWCFNGVRCKVVTSLVGYCRGTVLMRRQLLAPR